MFKFQLQIIILIVILNSNLEISLPVILNYFSFFLVSLHLKVLLHSANLPMHTIVYGYLPQTLLSWKQKCRLRFILTELQFTYF